MLKGFVLVSFSMILTGMISINAQTVSTVAKISGQIGGVGGDSAGNIYFTDVDNHKIMKVNTSGVVSAVAGRGTNGTGDGIGQAATFQNPREIAVDKSGNIFVIDGTGLAIRKIDNTTNRNVTTVNRISQQSLTRFRGIAVDSAGTPYYFFDYQLYKGSTPVCGQHQTKAQAKSVDGVGSNALFIEPKGLTIDSSGNLYTLDDGKLRKITPTFTVTSPATTPGNCGLAVDWAGFVYVSDCYNHTIYKWNFINNTFSKYAGSPGNFGTTDGAVGSALFNYPSQLVINGTSLYVADANNLSVRRIKP